MRIQSPWDAQLVARDWMQRMGFEDVVLGPKGADAGIDVEARRAVAQVKAHGKRPVGRPAIQGIKGVAVAIQKTPLFFSLTGYTNAAVEWAEVADVALFSLTIEGAAYPVNRIAHQLWDRLDRREDPWVGAIETLEGSRALLRASARDPESNARFTITSTPGLGSRPFTLRATAVSPDAEALRQAIEEARSREMLESAGRLTALLMGSKRTSGGGRRSKSEQLQQDLTRLRALEEFQPFEVSTASCQEAVDVLDRHLKHAGLSRMDFQVVVRPWDGASLPLP